MNERRLKKLEDVAKKSQLSLTVVLENIHDPLNIGAIMRTCDAVGIRKIFVVNDTGTKNHNTLTLGKRSSMGTRKWVDVVYFHDLELCIREVRKEFKHLYGAALGGDSLNYLEVDFTESVAIMLGNEKSGLSTEALNYCDKIINIPMVGMAESLNVSTAAAIILYEAFRQRSITGKYDKRPDISHDEAHSLLEKFQEKIMDRTRNAVKFNIKPFNNNPTEVH
ncbi:MAG: RNA methyltransferase [Saprospiraceae bacterium]|nr:RNA methyltransferase [Saprospiraceae bacterium]